MFTVEKLLQVNFSFFGQNFYQVLWMEYNSISLVFISIWNLQKEYLYLTETKRPSLKVYKFILSLYFSFPSFGGTFYLLMQVMVTPFLKGVRRYDLVIPSIYYWYVRRINYTCYKELSQSLKVKYFMAVQSFSLLVVSFEALQCHPRRRRRILKRKPAECNRVLKRKPS